MRVTLRRPWPAPAIVPALGLTLLFVAGCDQPTGSTRPQSRATQIAGIDETGGQLTPPPAAASAPSAPTAPSPPAARSAPSPPVAPREILNQRTQDIRDSAQEKKAGGVVTPPRITAKDPIRLTGNAYVSIVSNAASLNIKKAIDFYQADTGEYPKSTEEFMEKIIKANNIALPRLPFYQEYAFDVPTHSLVVMEYPDRKKAAGYPE
jgi:hypothetical protein